MRYIIPALFFFAVAGCGTTQVNEMRWSAEAAAELSMRCVAGCDASIVLDDSTGIEPVQVGRMRVERGELLWGSRNSPFVGSADTGLVRRVELRRRRHGRGALAGLGIGTVAGAAFGAILASTSWEPCQSTEPFGCLLHPESRGQAAVLGGTVLGAVGGLAGLLIGAIIGTEDVTVYRYRPGSPDQMRIVVGLSPARPLPEISAAR